MLDRKLTEAQAYHQIQRTTYAAALEALITANIQTIMDCSEITRAIGVHPRHRCELCPAEGKQTRSPFESFDHPHEPDNRLLRQLAEIYTWAPDTAESLVGSIVVGNVHWLGDQPNSPENVHAWKMLRTFQVQVETLRSCHAPEHFPAAIKPLNKVIIGALHDLMAHPSETQTKKNLREAAKTVLATNKALSKEAVNRLSVHLGELFGFEELIDSDFPAEARARRGRGN